MEGNSIVDRADLVVTLNTVERTYGSAELTKGTSYGFSVADSAWANGDQKDKSALKDQIIFNGTGVESTDTALEEENANGRVTENAGGGYSWGLGTDGNVVAGLVSAGANSEVARNYNVKVAAPGTSIINQAVLTASLKDIYVTYGNKDNKYIYVTNQNGEQEKSNVDGYQYVIDFVNGDTKDSGVAIEFTDAALDVTGLPAGAETNYVGSYGLTGTVTLSGTAAQNYKFVDGASALSLTAESHVEKAKLDVNLSDIHRIYGQEQIYKDATHADGSKTTYGASYVFDANDLVNGDNSADRIAALRDTIVVGMTSDGALYGENSDGIVTKDASLNAGDYKWDASVS